MDPDKYLLKASLYHEIERTLTTLNEREANVIRNFYGLGGLSQHSLDEIGEEFGLSREQVRQIKEKALST